MAAIEKKEQSPSSVLGKMEITEKIPPSSDVDALEARTDINEKKILRKLDRTLLPVLTLLYLLSFLDRSNVANARLEGLVDDLHMTPNEYLTGLTLYFIGYVLFEIPCNVVLKLSTPQIWLPTLTMVWGIVATLTGIVQNRAGFFAARFILGVTESGLFPGVVFYLSMWYKRNEQHYRVALFFSAASLAGAFGGILAYGIAHMRGVGGLNGWRWIFILEGILTIIISVAAYFFVVNYPATAKFLNEDERIYIQTRLSTDTDVTRNEAFTWANFSKALNDPKVWLYGFGFHTLSLPLYTLSLFLPIIIKELGYSAAQAQLLSVPPYAIATALTLLVAVASEKVHRRVFFIMGSSSIAIIGYILLLTDTRPSVFYLGTIFAASGIYSATTIVLSWPANNVSGQTKRATANAMQISIGNLGVVLSTQLYRNESRPRFFVGHGMALGYLVVNILVVGTLWWILKRENERRDRELGAERLRGIDEGEWLGDEDPRWRFQT